MKHFAVGFVTALVVVALAAWLGRSDIIKWVSIGYESVDQPIELLTTIELQQKGKAVGKIEKGTVLVIKGRAKDSPLEYFSVPLGWENRGVESQKVYRLIPKDQSAFVDMVVP